LPRYLVERTFAGGLAISVDGAGAEVWHHVVEQNTALGVTWIHSYVTDDREKSFCIYDGPDRDAVRIAAERSDLPIDRISEVRVLDPYFYR
jgi:hypothetical protein